MDVACSVLKEGELKVTIPVRRAKLQRGHSRSNITRTSRIHMKEHHTRRHEDLEDETDIRYTLAMIIRQQRHVQLHAAAGRTV